MSTGHSSPTPKLKLFWAHDLRVWLALRFVRMRMPWAAKLAAPWLKHMDLENGDKP